MQYSSIYLCCSDCRGKQDWQFIFFRLFWEVYFSSDHFCCFVHTFRCTFQQHMVKEFWKSVEIWLRCGQGYGIFFGFAVCFFIFSDTSFVSHFQIYGLPGGRINQQFCFLSNYFGLCYYYCHLACSMQHAVCRFLYDVSQIPSFVDRCFCLMFLSTFSESLSLVDSRLTNISSVVQVIDSLEFISGHSRILGLCHFWIIGNENG